MANHGPSEYRVPALFTAVGNLISNYFKEIAAITGSLGGIVAILDSLFGIQLVPYGTALADFLASDGFMASLLLVVLISQILLYQRVEWIVKQLEPATERGEQQDSGEPEETEEPREILTDGGSSNHPPRDSKGRFTTKDSGGSNAILLILAAVTGYLFSSQTGIVDPFAGALIAIALVSLFQAMDS